MAAWIQRPGVAIDLWNHARHSSLLLIQNYPIRGLDQREVLLAAMAAYLHEGNSLPSEWKKGFLPIIRTARSRDRRPPRRGPGRCRNTSPRLRPRFSLADGGKGSLGELFFFYEGYDPSPRWAEKVRKLMEQGLRPRGALPGGCLILRLPNHGFPGLPLRL